MSDSEDYGDSEADEDLTIRNLEISKSPGHNDLVSLLECPVCLDLPLPPIRTCCQGHIICSLCCPRLMVCPLCQQHIGTGRNFFAEDFLNKSTMKCKFSPDGCLTELSGSKIREHMDTCFYRPIKCRQCGRKVAFSDIDDHLFNEHQISPWDLNEEGVRIVTCQKLRTRNPHARIVQHHHWSLDTIVVLFLLVIFASVADVCFNASNEIVSWDKTVASFVSDALYRLYSDVIETCMTLI